MANNSDYKKPRTNIFDLLPSVYQSDVNRSILENLENRFLTKNELVKVVGMIGQKLPSDTDVSLIPEETVHRQAWQLQPAIHQKIATVDHISSYYDVLQQIERLGVDSDRLPLWGNTPQFNFVPPIDLDKMVNYVNYYWYDPDNPNSTPQYITVQNKCNKAQSVLNALIADVGGTLLHDIVSISSGTNEIKIVKDYTSAFQTGQTFKIELSDTNNGEYTVETAVFDGYYTTIRVAEPLNGGDTALGRISIESRLEEFFVARDCACDGQMGWGSSLWDDNAGFNAPPPSGVPQPTGANNWDQSDNCKPQLDAWSQENKWMHFVDVPNLSIATRAEMPILEYFPDLELNEWSKTTYRWKYRSQENAPWVEVDSEPSYVEMVNGYAVLGWDESQPPGGGAVVIAGHVGSEFPTGARVTLVDNSGGTRIFTVLLMQGEGQFYGQPATWIFFEEDLIGGSALTDKLFPSDRTSRGDIFLGFHKQWLYVGVKNIVPVENQPPSETISAEEFTIPDGTTGLGLRQFVLTVHPSDAIKDSDDVRVYVNGYREYVTYKEMTEFDLTGSGDDLFVRGIEFFADSAKQPGDLIRIEVSAPSSLDDGREQVAVRTVEDDTEFETLALSGLQPELKSVIRFRKVEQTKQPGEVKYPFFNIYNVDQTFHGVSPIFKFLESDDAELDMRLGGKRIVVTDFGKNFHFEQELVDDTTGTVYAYKDLATVDADNLEGFQTIWRKGYGDAEFYTPKKVTADRLPVENLEISSSDSVTKVFTIASSHGDLTKLLVPTSLVEVTRSTVDDGIYTVASSTYDGIHTRVTVNEHINTSTLGDGVLTSLLPSDWEIPNQLYYNASHENRRVVTFSELLTHFSTIIENQSPPSYITQYSPSLWRILDKPNYGMGGTIKEHNDSYDTFLSSIFVNSSNPLRIIEFAQNRYETNLNFISETFKQNLLSQLTVVDDLHLVDLNKTVAAQTITIFEQNDINSKTFGDSNTYNKELGEGIRGWVATTPFIRLKEKESPVWLIDETLGISELLHHDGHITETVIPSSVADAIIEQLIETQYSSSASEGTWCYSTATPPETNYNTYFSTYTGRRGKFWYDTSTSTLYRFTLNHITSTQPAVSTTLEGTFWYDTVSEILYQKQSGTWVQVNGNTQDITEAWSIVNVEEMFREQMLEVEQRLFRAAPETPAPPVFDFSTLNGTAEDQTTFAKLEEEAFAHHLQRSEILDPYTVDNYYDSANPFTWNYKDVPNSPAGLGAITQWPTTAAGTTKPWGATWWTIYEQIFGTPYPHLEPWKLQGYRGKPTWWDEEYKDVTGARRWVYNHTINTGMWENIRTGVVPAGRTYPSGAESSGNPYADGEQLTTYNYFCVNIDNVPHGGYGPDDLLPPYASGVDFVYPSTNRSLLSTMANTIPDNPTTFPGLTLIYQDYVYGDNGPVEWEWRKSSQYAYDLLKIAFKMQPVRFMHHAWGNDYYDIGGLNIDQRTEQVFSHKITKFHGDLINNEVYVVPGLNQWYTNYNRYNSLDNKISDFREMWVGWDPTLMYQFGSMVETKSFEIATRSFDLTDQDYNIVLKRSPGLHDYWIDSLRISTSKFGPRRIGIDDASDWTFIVDVPTDVGRTVKYYDVQTTERSTFLALGGVNTSEIWKHYYVDKDTVLETTFPKQIVGMQNVINFIDGYTSYAENQGFIFNDSTVSEVDQDTGRLVNWQTEIERFIDLMYRLRAVQYDPTQPYTDTPTFELNPLRNNIWFNNDKGIIANIQTGPNQDIFTEQTIYDQYGRPLSNDKLHVFREDKKGHIAILPQQANDVEPNLTGSEYNYLHIGGIHLFVDGYEHTLLFSDRTTTGKLLYDPFVGLDAKVFGVEFDKLNTSTQRPNAGGFFLSDNELVANFEESIESLQQTYDILRVSGNSLLSQHAQELVGFEDPTYFDNLGINNRSKFMFWRGMIQNKGSVNSIQALINSNQFEEAELDEFWAYRTASFGSADRLEYPEVNLFDDDVNRDQLRLQFTNSTNANELDNLEGGVSETTSESSIQITPVFDPLQPGFKQVRGDDEDRWFHAPDQINKFVEGANNLFFDAEVTSVDENPVPKVNSIFETDVIADDVRIVFFQGDESVALPTANPNGPYIAATGEAVTSPTGITSTGSTLGNGPGPLTYLWDFGDGLDNSLIETSENPVKIYTTAGRYTITLTVNDGAFDSLPASTTIDVYDRPIADPYESPHTATENVAVTLNGSRSISRSGGVLSYQWDFDYDGVTFTPTGTGVSPQHTYTSTGTYTVGLRVNDGIFDSLITTTTISVKFPVPIADPGGPLTGSVNIPLTTFDGSASQSFSGNPLTYLWDFGDGGTGTGQNPSHTYATAGIFTVTLTVNDGYQNSLPAQTIATIIVGNPVAEANGPYTVQVNNPVTLSATGSIDPGGATLNYQWDIDNNGSFDYGPTTIETQTHTYTTIGTYTVRLRADNGAIFDEDTSTVNVIAAPPPVAEANGPYSGAQGEDIAFSSAGSSDPSLLPITYLWEFGNGDTSTEPNPIYVYPSSGNFTATLTVDNGFSSVIATAPVIVNPAIVPTGMSIDTVNYGGGLNLNELPEDTPAAWNFSATVNMSDGSSFVISNEAVWSGNQEYAVIDANTGIIDTLVLPLNHILWPHVNVTISAQYVYPGNGQVLTANLVVKIINNPPALVSIEISGPPSLCECGDPSSYTALGTYNDGSTSDITNDVTWSASEAWVSNTNNNFSVNCNSLTTTTSFNVQANMGSINDTFAVSAINVGTGDWSNLQFTECQGTPVLMKSGTYDSARFGTIGSADRFIVVVNSATDGQLFYYELLVNGTTISITEAPGYIIGSEQQISLGGFSATQGVVHQSQASSGTGPISFMYPVTFSSSGPFTVIPGQPSWTYFNDYVITGNVCGLSPNQGVFGFTTYNKTKAAAIALNLSGSGASATVQIGNGPANPSGAISDSGGNYVHLGNQTSSDKRVRLTQSSSTRALTVYGEDLPERVYTGLLDVSGTSISLISSLAASESSGGQLSIGSIGNGAAVAIYETDTNALRALTVSPAGTPGTVKTISSNTSTSATDIPDICQAGTDQYLLGHLNSTSLYIRTLDSNLNNEPLASNFFASGSTPTLYNLDNNRILVVYRMSSGYVAARVLQV